MTAPRKPAPSVPTAADLRRWRRAAHVALKEIDAPGCACRGCNLARDVLRVLDRGGRRRPR